MSKGWHTEAQIIASLKQLEPGRKIEDVARDIPIIRLHRHFGITSGLPDTPTTLCRRVNAGLVDAH